MPTKPKSRSVKSAYKRTKRTFADKDGKKRTIFTKDGKEYVQRRSKTTGKVRYVAV